MMTRYRGRGDLLHLLTVHLLAVDGSGGRSGRRRLTVHLLLGTVRILLLLAVDGSNGCGDVRRSRRLTVRGSGCAIHLGGGGGGFPATARAVDDVQNLWRAVRADLQAVCAWVDARVEDADNHAASVVIRVRTEKRGGANLLLGHLTGDSGGHFYRR